LHGQVDDCALGYSAGGGVNREGHRSSWCGGYCVAGAGAAGDETGAENQNCEETEKPDIAWPVAGTVTGEGEEDCAEG
jgi:hypothetical protein